MSLSARRTRGAIYAEAMGIDVWLPRRPLAGAADGHVVLRLQPSAAATPGREAQKLQTNPAAELAASLEPRVKKSVESTSSASTADIEKNVVGGVGAFELCAVIHEEMLIVDDISGLQVAASAYQNWLNALFFVLGKPAFSNVLTGHNRLQWPPAERQNFTSVDIDYAATEMVVAWLERKLETNKAENGGQSTVRKILLMGSAAATILATAGNSSQPSAVSVSLFDDLPVLILPGTAQLWREPQLKRNLWQGLQSLMD